MLIFQYYISKYVTCKQITNRDDSIYIHTSFNDGVPTSSGCATSASSVSTVLSCHLCRRDVDARVSERKTCCIRVALYYRQTHEVHSACYRCFFIFPFFKVVFKEFLTQLFIINNQFTWRNNYKKLVVRAKSADISKYIKKYFNIDFCILDMLKSSDHFLSKK